MRATQGCLLLLLTVVPCTAVNADTIWRYRGPDGEMAYAAQPPAGVAAEAIEVPTASTRSTPDNGTTSAGAAPITPAPSRLTPEQQDALDGLLAAEAKRAQESARLRDANCARARGVLERLQASGRIRVRDAEGQERAMSEAERETRIADAAQVVAEQCGANTASADAGAR
ncbi:MAG: hypothetical protein ACO3Z6_04460 [Pseudomonadales bacterium]